MSVQSVADYIVNDDLAWKKIMIFLLPLYIKFSVEKITTKKVDAYFTAFAK